VAVILKVVIIRHTQEIPVIRGREASMGQGLHFWSVIGFKGMLSCSAYIVSILESTLVDGRYDFLSLLIKGVQARISVFLQTLNQMCLKEADMVFYGGLFLVIGNC